MLGQHLKLAPVPMQVLVAHADYPVSLTIRVGLVHQLQHRTCHRSSGRLSSRLLCQIADLCFLFRKSCGLNFMSCGVRDTAWGCTTHTLQPMQL